MDHSKTSSESISDQNNLKPPTESPEHCLSSVLDTTSLSPTQQQLIEALDSVLKFKEFLIKFYKDFGYDLNKTQAANSQIEYIYNLFISVYKAGGWSFMNGTNSWGALSKVFGSMQGSKLREDYENFLFALEKAYGIHKYENKVVDSFLIDINPELMVVYEWFQPSLLINEVNRAMVQRFLRLDCVVVPQFVNKMLGVCIEMFSKDEIINKKVQFSFIDHSFSLLELLGFDSFYVECPLENVLELYEELGNKLVDLIHWNGKENLLRYSQNIAGVSSPLLIVMKNSYTLIGGPSYLNLNGAYLVMHGFCEYFGIHTQHMKQLNKRVQKDLGIDIFLNNWKPTEQYLLSNNIEFTYIKASPGDVVVSKTDIVYWVISDFCVMVDYFLLPSFRIQETCESYKITKSDPHKFNLPLLCIEYLNKHMLELDTETLNSMKKVVSEGVDEEYWTGNFGLEVIDYRSCSICAKDLVWRYVRCPICITEKFITSLCLKCAQEHKCKSLEYIEKFSTQDLEKFYNRLEKRTSDPSQDALCKVSVKFPEKGAGDSVKYDPASILPSKIEFISIPRANFNMKSDKKGVEPGIKQEPEWDLEKCYKKLGKKKQKIREAMENPITGPRFNYDFPLKTQKDSSELSSLHIPIQPKSKINPLSTLVKQKSTTALSSLIKPSHKSTYKPTKNLK